jgi:transcription-repair coupling factor (superfamily II helicase)
MYQLRGRVGRADEQAFAYLFIPPESHLSKDAQKRLKVLMENSGLGSGFQIAMNDLKIRGGGSILGASQSGHIAAVGYDMFLQLMEQAIAEQKGQVFVEPLDPEINVIFSTFIPESYIPDIDQRMSAYRRLARMTELADIAEFKKEMADRYGAVPVEAANLLLKFMLKILSVKAGVRRLDLDNRHLSLHFSLNHLANPQAIAAMAERGGRNYRLSPDHVLRIGIPEGRKRDGLALAKNILKEITQHGNA